MLEVDTSHAEVIRRIVRSRLERFFEMLWPQFSAMRHESHEKLAEFGGSALRVVVRIDLTCWNPSHQLVIVDWKTGGWQNQMGGRGTACRLCVMGGDYTEASAGLCSSDTRKPPNRRAYKIRADRVRLGIRQDRDPNRPRPGP